MYIFFLIKRVIIKVSKCTQNSDMPGLLGTPNPKVSVAPEELSTLWGGPSGTRASRPLALGWICSWWGWGDLALDWRLGSLPHTLTVTLPLHRALHLWGLKMGPSSLPSKPSLLSKCHQHFAFLDLSIPNPDTHGLLFGKKGYFKEHLRHFHS